MTGSKDFFQQLREGEQYASMFVDMDLLNHIKENFESEEHYRLNSIKEHRPEYKEDELLCELYKKSTKLNKQIRDREYDINHNNK